MSVRYFATRVRISSQCSNQFVEERKGNRQQTFPQITVTVSLKLKMIYHVTKLQQQRAKREFPICVVVTEQAQEKGLSLSWESAIYLALVCGMDNSMLRSLI